MRSISEAEFPRLFVPAIRKNCIPLASKRPFEDDLSKIRDRQLERQREREREREREGEKG